MHNIHTVYKRKYIYVYTVYYIHVSFTNIVKTVETNCPTVECNDCTGGFGGDALTDLNVLLILWSSQIIKFIGEAKSWQQPFPIWLLTSPEVTVIWPNMTCLYIHMYIFTLYGLLHVYLSIYHICIYICIYFSFASMCISYERYLDMDSFCKVGHFYTPQEPPDQNTAITARLAASPS